MKMLFINQNSSLASKKKKVPKIAHTEQCTYTDKKKKIGTKELRLVYFTQFHFIRFNFILDCRK